MPAPVTTESLGQQNWLQWTMELAQFCCATPTGAHSGQGKGKGGKDRDIFLYRDLPVPPFFPNLTCNRRLDSGNGGKGIQG